MRASGEAGGMMDHKGDKGARSQGGANGSTAGVSQLGPGGLVS